ncbi:MAG: dockerin type I domain-containing protein, partial [SAR202 cluster bacterium]|nr:dockerin type I domain-containing protein [SAR202 cluster bacterium]
MEHSTKAFAEKIDSTVYDFDYCDGADVDRNKIVEKADLEEYIEKLKSDCRNIADVDINLIIDALKDNNFDKECTTNNNLCELLDINLDGELTPLDLNILIAKMSGCTGSGNPNIDSNADLNEDGYVNYLDREILLIALADKPIGTIDCNEDDRSNNVCYGDLRCRSIDTSDSNPGSCDGTEEKIVASLSAATGARISKGDDTGSSIKICCKLEVTQLESAYWAYMNDEIIESIDSAGEDVIIGLKDKVKLVVGGKEFKDKNINYKIFKKCSGFVGCTDAFFTGDDVVAQTTVKGEFIWDAGKKLDYDTFSEGKYYFSAKIGELEVFSSENSDGSENLNGILTVGPEDNDPPVAKIKFPLDRQIYFVNSPITFEQGSFDLDD